MLDVNIEDSDWPEWAQWVAQDKDGLVAFYQNEPNNDRQTNQWTANGDWKSYRFLGRKQPNPNWKQAIMKRPQTQADENEPERKHSHYFKDVSNLQKIDIYRVLDLYEVTDPCVQHAVKKLLVAGKRGAKDKPKDIQEAIDTLTRWQDMQGENNG